MGFGRWGAAFAAAAVVVASLGLSAAPASADATTVPTMQPIIPSVVWGDVTISAESTAVSVQFFVDGTALGTPVPVSSGSATTTWSTWSFADGNHSVTAADCDTPTSGCNTTQSSASAATVANVPTGMTPADGSTVSGDVTIIVSAITPDVEFYENGVAIGDPVTVSSGNASTTWSTSSLPYDEQDTWTAAGCADATVGSCDMTQSAPVVLTVQNAPTLSAPAGGSQVSGVVPISVTTTAPSVQFAVDGVPLGAPVAVTANTASATWTSWGAVNGAHSLTATACDNATCGPAATVGVTLANSAPSITSPASGAQTGPGVSFSATVPGGGLAFFLDGTRAGFVAAAPYTFTPPTPLGAGSHTVVVHECDTTGTVCNGPTSTTTSFSVGQLSPAIVGVWPNPFSPGKDGRADTTTFRVHLSTPQRLSWSIENSNSVVIQGPHASGVLAAGTYSYSWDGRGNAGKLASDGMYSVIVQTSSGTGASTLYGTATAKVTVDRTPTRFSTITGNQATFYPVRDGFLDAFRPSVHVNESGLLWLEISTIHNTPIRTVGLAHTGAGTYALGWNGRNAKGALMPSGNYHFRFLAQDRAGNRSASRRLLLHLSHRRAVRKTIVVTRNGDQGRPAATNSYCTQYSLGLSSFDHGLFLDNSCDRGFDGPQTIFADYVLAVPGAVQYDSIQVRSVGQTVHAPEPISAFVYSFSASQWDPAGSIVLHKNAKPGITTFRRLSGNHHVTLRHRVKIRLSVPDTVTPEDYDIASATIVVTYDVLG